jgi:hypothetical protein
VQRPHADRTFFVRMGLLLLALIVGGFGGRALTHHEELPPAAAVVVPHVLTISLWYVLLPLQASRIGRDRRRLHRLVGYASVPLAIALLWTGGLVMAANYRLKHDAPLVLFNLINLVQFAGLFSAALLTVRRPAAHKRLMLWASIAMMPPALVRMMQALSLPEALTVLPIVALWVPCLRHDRATLGRVHTTTWCTIAVIAFGIAIGGPIGFSGWWAELVERWLGSGA